MVELPPEQRPGGSHSCSGQATSEPMSAGVPAMAGGCCRSRRLVRARFPMKQVYKRRNQTRVVKQMATVETCNGIVNMYVYDMTMRRPSKTPNEET